MKNIVLFFFAALLSCNLQNEDKRPERVKQKSIQVLLKEHNNCKASDHKNECKHFVAQAICEYSGINDFIDSSGEYISYQDIYDQVIVDENWKDLGDANIQETLENAQKLANNGYPVIAINTNDKHKFSVQIIKGELSKSRSWNLNTPNTAAFFPSSGPASYINKPLSYSWSSSKGIKIFVKK